MQININAGDLNNLAIFLQGYEKHVVSGVDNSRKKHAYMIEAMAKGKVAVKAGHLRRSINTKHGGNYSLIGTNVVYARAREYGSRAYVIRPKRAKFLRFKGRDGKWVFTKKVNYPAGKGKKPYLIPSLEEVAPKFANDVERILSNYA